ncbi:endonuclease MutS2 [Acidipila sp. EB88]|nr:endonuclease MutS2 [Acidipila sp. EB88]
MLTPVVAPLAEFARTTLEWGRLLQLLEAYAASDLGREWLATLVPSGDLAWIDRQHALVQEMQLLLAEGVRPTLAGLSDPTQLLAKSRLTGAALEVEEIRTLLSLADAVSSWAGTMRHPPDRYRDGGLPGLRALTEPILSADLRPLVESIQGKLLPDGTLADSASAELGRIRRDIDRQQRTIETSLRSALRRLSEGGTAQDELITIRGDRFVIPVKAEAKRKVSGVVHGASSSGQTVYLEPLETIELNNDLVRLFEEELAEIHRIFLAMTAQLAAQAHLLVPGAGILATVETLLIRARFAQEYDAVRPRFTTGPGAELRLVAARHPLLEHRLRESATAGASGRNDAEDDDGEHVAATTATRPPQMAKIVPLSIVLEADRRQLIISGPNTGGKTVGLKTTGLLSLMAQSGIPVPAFEATLPVLTAVLADIGDAQSIEQNLSTFSAHITNLNRVSSLAGAATLVLIDEVGSATDPDEGSALAVAIAEHILHTGAWSILSTHLTSLKIYGETTPGVVNASVGFNAETLAPTYELRQGVPGASAGINIAQRLGLAPAIVERARARMTTQALDIGAFLDRLHAEIAALGEERITLQAEEKALRKERHRLETEGMQEMRARTRELENELNTTLRELETKSKEAVQAIEDRAAREKAAAEAERRSARLRREFSEKFTAQVRSRKPNAMQQAAAQVAAHQRDPRTAGLGDTVKLRIGQSGRVTREIDSNTLEVSIGSMKMRVRRTDVAAILVSAQPSVASPTPVEAASGKRNITVRTSAGDEDELRSSMRHEINVIGLTADHAEDEVQKFIDQAFLSGLQRVRVVHGTGMGVLRRTLRAALARHPHVTGVTEADQYEGGQGATIVELRQ